MVTMLVGIASYLLYILSIFIFIDVILSLLISFNVINTHNDFVRMIWQALDKLLTPIYRPFRRILPEMGGLDLAPMLVLILINILRSYVLPELLSPSFY
jgi:YggT family protein